MRRKIRLQITQQPVGMRKRNCYFILLLAALLCNGGESFSNGRKVYSAPSFYSSSLSSVTESTTEELNLTPELQKLTNFFARFPDEKGRYKQLLMFSKQLPPVDSSILIPENKVPGCLSTVHVDCTAEIDEERGEQIVNFIGDSDGLLTKGLLTLLIRGLSGYTADEIEAVNPKFMTASKIDQSLTPSRNNGFLNMLKVMKQKARQAVSSPNQVITTEESNNDEEEEMANDDDLLLFNEIEGKPMYNEIMSTLTSTLKPNKIDLIDKSYEHAGHAGSKGWEESGESHFYLYVESDAFEGLPLVKRHQLIYMLLSDVMNKIHALQINAKAPSEV